MLRQFSGTKYLLSNLMTYLSLILGTHTVEGDNWLQNVVFDFHMYSIVCVHIYTYHK